MRGALPLEPELERLGISDVLLDHRVEVEDGVLRGLLRSDRWRLVHADRHALILRHADALGDAEPLDTQALAATARTWTFPDEAPDRFAPTRALRLLRLLPSPRRFDPIERLGTARMLELVGQPQAALDLARQALDLAPDSPLVWRALGELEAAHGSAAAAQTLFEKAAASDAGDPLPCVKLGLIALRGGDTRAAVRWFEEALARDPDSRLARENLLAAHEVRADPMEIRRTLARAGELPPGRRPYYLGVAAAIEGELGLAARALTAAVQEDPSLAPGQARLAEVLGKQGRLEEAERAWERLCELTPSDPSAWRALGRLRLARGDGAGALEAWRSAARLPGEVDALLLAAQVHLRRGERREARAAAEEALRRAPNHRAR